jgi:uncharacterized protein YdaU (DUF1376 family)
MADHADLPMLIWIESFKRRTADLSTTEMGVYCRLLCAMWLDPKGSLPNENGRMARIVKCDHRNFVRWYLPRIVKRFFTLGSDNRWRQDWVTKQIEQIDEFSAKQKNIAKIGWEKRKNGGFYQADLFGRPVDNPVDNPVESCGKDLYPDYPDHEIKKASKINGAVHASGDARAMPILKKESEFFSYVGASRHARDNNSSKKEIKKIGTEAQTAPHRNYPQARQAWEVALARKLGPAAYAEAVRYLATDQPLCERATAAEQRKPGSGVMAALLGLRVHTLRARP